MKKITTILSPLVLLATTALAQDSTCILQPSCSQLGYTSSETDCGTQKVLRCPFDVSQVACVGGSGSGAGGGSGGDGDYNPNDPNNELGDVIALKFGTGAVNLIYGGGNIFVDCGEGTFVSGYNLGMEGSVSCPSSSESRIVKLSGDFTYYGGSSPYPLALLKLDKKGITKMSDLCGNSSVKGTDTTYVNGLIPPLPSTLKDATNMFAGCRGLSSSYPKLPEGLEIADNMFSPSHSGVTGDMRLSGNVNLPSSLKSAAAMFYRNKYLNSVTNLENTLITNGASMFYDCINMTGTLTALPSSLTNGSYMFKGTKITGSPAKPAGLTNYTYMFSESGVQVDWD